MWDTQTLPDTTIPNNNRRFYVFNGSTDISVALPASPETNLFNGWSVFIANDSESNSITITGDFVRTTTSIVISSGDGLEIVYYMGPTTDVQYFVRGSSRM